MSLLVVEGLTKHFGGVAAVSDLSFKVDQAQIKAVIGPNGAGKTTLFNLLTGLERPDAGRIRFDGRDITAARPDRIAAEGVARTFQTSQLFEPMTVMDNVMVGCHRWTAAGIVDALARTRRHRLDEREAREWSEHCLSLAGIARLADLPASSLAHGQRRLLELARALASKPALLLLDEPAAGLSGPETLELEQTLYRARDAGATVVLVEHDMGLVMRCSDEVLVLLEGARLAEGPPLLVRQDQTVISAYLGQPHA
jgi:branched-chain amino acid transport system ATP-binding protein